MLKFWPCYQAIVQLNKLNFLYKLISETSEVDIYLLGKNWPAFFYSNCKSFILLDGCQDLILNKNSENQMERAQKASPLQRFELISGSLCCVIGFLAKTGLDYSSFEESVVIACVFT